MAIRGVAFEQRRDAPLVVSVDYSGPYMSQATVDVESSAATLSAQDMSSTLD